MDYYFKINDTDYSKYVNKLVVGTEHMYDVKTATMSGRRQITYKRKMKVLEVGIIPLDQAIMARLLTDINQFDVSISYRDPETNTLVENLRCIIPSNLVEYYTIRADKVSYKAFSFQVQEV